VNLKNASELIKQQALRLGFFACGIAKADFLKDHEPRLKKWLHDERYGEMAYMANHFNKRLDTSKLVEGARSVIVVLQNYYPEEPLPPGSDYLISRYAYGTDYHFVIKEKLGRLREFIQNQIAPHQCRVFTDSAPVLERAWAVKAGLGWIGKNSMLITPRNGSYFFIGEIITDLELVYDEASGGDYCGDCTRCIDACPTSAIGNDRMIDSRKCISYLTIEKRGELPEEYRGEYKQWIFGCDICQEVCPWNRFAFPHNEDAFRLVDVVRDWEADDWENLNKETFNKVFGKSPLKRARFAGIKRNIQYLKNPGKAKQ
jgi:epoxyqueuosine reductase